MKHVERLLAEKLLAISAIKLQPDNPFTLASGWNSPIYTDNRKTLSYPAVRTFVKTEMCRVILENFGDVDVIAGVATGGVAQGAIVADALGLPYVYVRTEPKDHGLENLIEGHLKLRQRVVVVEDQVSTGQSLLKAVDAVSAAGCQVVGMASMFTYGFAVAERSLAKSGIKYVPLCTYDAMLEVALETGYITKADLPTLQQWRDDPETWAPTR